MSEIVLLVAEKETNALMAYFDLCPPYKAFIVPVLARAKRMSKKKILNLIESSKAEPKYWIPAIIWRGRMYAAEGIKELSDGKQIMFVSQWNRKSKPS